MPSGLVPPPPPEAFPPPIASLAELEEAFAVQVQGPVTWIETERLLAGLVDFAHRDPEGVRATLKPTFEADHWYATDAFGDPVMGRFAPVMVAQAFWYPKMRPEGQLSEEVARRTLPLEMFLGRRTREIAMMIGRTPQLLSTPTSGSGQLDTATLISRLERLEAQDREPGPIDLAQALLRLPPEAGS
ncbi:hypothetical protein ACFQ07_08330, partial [Actinomadura adrarensis]